MTSRLLAGFYGKIRSMPPEMFLKTPDLFTSTEPAGFLLTEYLHWGAAPQAENWRKLAVSLSVQGKLSHLD